MRVVASGNVCARRNVPYTNKYLGIGDLTSRLQMTWLACARRAPRCYECKAVKLRLPSNVIKILRDQQPALTNVSVGMPVQAIRNIGASLLRSFKVREVFPSFWQQPLAFGVLNQHHLSCTADLSDSSDRGSANCIRYLLGPRSGK